MKIYKAKITVEVVMRAEEEPTRTATLSAMVQEMKNGVFAGSSCSVTRPIRIATVDELPRHWDDAVPWLITNGKAGCSDDERTCSEHLESKEEEPIPGHTDDEPTPAPRKPTASYTF